MKKFFFKCFFKNKLHTANKAFTLLEVMIALMILSGLALMTARSTRQASQMKQKIQISIDDQALIRSALKVMEKDINLAFHYRDINYEIYKKVDQQQKAKNKKKKSNTSVSGGSEASIEETEDEDVLNPSDEEQDKQGKVQSRSIESYLKSYKAPSDIPHFIGKREELHFASLSHIRSYNDAPESEQSEVSYFLQNCKSRSEEGKVTKCLWRRTSPYIDDKPEEGGSKIVLLENVKSLNFRYFGPNKEDWVEEWSSKSSGDGTQNIFPNAVEINIVLVKNEKDFAHSIIAELRFPNNPPDTQVEAPKEPLSGR